MQRYYHYCGMGALTHRCSSLLKWTFWCYGALVKNSDHKITSRSSEKPLWKVSRFWKILLVMEWSNYEQLGHRLNEIYEYKHNVFKNFIIYIVVLCPASSLSFIIMYYIVYLRSKTKAYLGVMSHKEKTRVTVLCRA